MEITEQMKKDYLKDNPRSGQYGFDTKRFKKWYHQKVVKGTPLTTYILPCLVNEFSGDNKSESLRKLIRDFFDIHFQKLISLQCSMNDCKPQSINLPDELKELLESMHEMGFTCSKSESLRFIMLIMYLMRDSK